MKSKKIEYTGERNLKKAIAAGELNLFIESNYKYITKSIYGADVMNDFYDIVIALNNYGEKNKRFVSVLKQTILDVLNEDKIYYTYSVVNIVYEQIQLTNRGKNKIDFVDVDIITAIKNSIINRKEELSNSTGYEGSLYTNGLLGVYERINQYIIENNGTAIL